MLCVISVGALYGCEKPVAVQMKRWKQKWVCLVLKKDSPAIGKQVLCWNPQGQHRREMPRKSWRRAIEVEVETVASKRSCAQK